MKKSNRTKTPVFTTGTSLLTCCLLFFTPAIAQTDTVSGRIPDFSVTDPEGNVVSVRGLVSQSKYTLIDFWASWCRPCRAAIPKLTEAYEAYHGKGFDIIGISTDASEAAWKKALAEDNTPWQHGLDNVGKAAKNLFGIPGVPQYMLVDSAGRVIVSRMLVADSHRIPATHTFDEDKSWMEILEELFGTPGG